MPSLFNVSVAASIGLHATVLLADSDSPMQARKMAETLGISEAHLSKVLRRLVRSDLVRGRPGPGGGFELAHSPERITLKEIYEAIEGPIDVLKCPLDVPLCNGGRCLLGDEFKEAGRKLVGFMERARLSDYRKASCIAREIPGK
jgi:Rrf2 family protein